MNATRSHPLLPLHSHLHTQCRKQGLHVFDGWIIISPNVVDPPVNFLMLSSTRQLHFDGEMFFVLVRYEEPPMIITDSSAKHSRRLVCKPHPLQRLHRDRRVWFFSVALHVLDDAIRQLLVQMLAPADSANFQQPRLVRVSHRGSVHRVPERRSQHVNFGLQRSICLRYRRGVGCGKEPPANLLNSFPMSTIAATDQGVLSRVLQLLAQWKLPIVGIVLVGTIAAILDVRNIVRACPAFGADRDSHNVAAGITHDFTSPDLRIKQPLF